VDFRLAVFENVANSLCDPEGEAVADSDDQNKVELVQLAWV
jgi:hypothetical protein